MSLKHNLVYLTRLLRLDANLPLVRFEIAIGDTVHFMTNEEVIDALLGLDESALDPIVPIFRRAQADQRDLNKILELLARLFLESSHGLPAGSSTTHAIVPLSSERRSALAFLNAFFAEKDLPYILFELEHEGLTHFISNEDVIEAIYEAVYSAPDSEFTQIVALLRRADFQNRDINLVLEGLARALIAQWATPT